MGRRGGSLTVISFAILPIGGLDWGTLFPVARREVSLGWGRGIDSPVSAEQVLRDQTDDFHQVLQELIKWFLRWLDGSERTPGHRRAFQNPSP